MKTLYEEIMKSGYKFIGFKPETQKRRNLITSSLDRAEIIQIQNVADYWYEISDQGGIDIEDFPNLAPPFPEFWMEFSMPRFFKEPSGAIYENKNVGEKFGFLLYAIDVEKDTEHNLQWAKTNPYETKWVVVITGFAGRERIAQAMNWQILLDKNGKVSHFPDGKIGFITALPEPNETMETMKDAVYMLLTPVLLAVSFLHCKNVEMIARDPNKSPGKRLKRNQSKIRYHTLHIEPMKKVLREEGQSETTGIKRALHICRGHFKDFSKGKGLFGKYQGLYWWDSQVRGNSKHGITMKDYNIDTPEES